MFFLIGLFLSFGAALLALLAWTLPPVILRALRLVTLSAEWWLSIAVLPAAAMVRCLILSWHDYTVPTDKLARGYYHFSVVGAGLGIALGWLLYRRWLHQRFVSLPHERIAPFLTGVAVLALAAGAIYYLRVPHELRR